VCGYAVDWLRSCYSSTWRFPSDSVPTRKGYFFFAPEGTPHYPGWSYFGSRNWHKGDGTDWPDFGELENTRQVWRDGSFPTTPPDAKLIGSQECIEFGNTSDSPAAALIAGINIGCWAKRPPWGGLVGGGASHQATALGGLVGGGSSHELEVLGGLVGGGRSHELEVLGGLVGGGSSHELEVLGGLVGGGSSHELEVLGGLVGGGSSHELGALGGLVGGGHQQAAGLVGGLVGGGSSTFSNVAGSPFIQAAHAQTAAGSTASTSVSFASATHSGNWLVVILTASNSQVNVNFSVPSGWTAPVVINNNAFVTCAIAYLENVGAGTTFGPFGVTSVAGFGTLALNVQIAEFHGLPTSGTFDKQVVARATSTNPASGATAALVQAKELIIGACGTSHGVAITTATGYTVQDSYTGNSTGAGAWQSTWAWKTVNATTAVSITFTDTSSTWGCIVRTFKLL